uniref:Uncharacterized protein n=1 Tax=Anguilla anguilla TaxID=7936 RepID=A0A0E9UTN1_ANGAN
MLPEVIRFSQFFAVKSLLTLKNRASVKNGQGNPQNSVILFWRNQMKKTCHFNPLPPLTSTHTQFL